MKKAILIYLISLAAFTSVISIDTKPAEANGRAIYHGAKGVYHSARGGSQGGLIFFGALLIGGFAVAASQSK